VASILQRSWHGLRRRYSSVSAKRLVVGEWAGQPAISDPQDPPPNLRRGSEPLDKRIQRL